MSSSATPGSDSGCAGGGAKSRLVPFVAKQLDFLVNNFPQPIIVEQFWSGCKNGKYNDRFTLQVPFCLDYVKWDVIYNAYFPEKAPDIVFPAEDEGFQPLLEFNGLSDKVQRRDDSVLMNWDYKDPKILLTLIEQIRAAYAEYQMQLISKIDDERLKFEMNTILSRQGIEVRLISLADRPDEVKIVVPLLDIDLNKLVPGCPWATPQRIYLQVNFSVSRSYPSASSAPRLKLLSTSDLKVFFSTDDVILPPWLNDMCMAEYLPRLEDTLNDKVVQASGSIGSRRRFIEALAPFFGRPLEADPVFCRRATVLIASGLFTFLVHFSIPLQFPNVQPTLYLQSSQHFNSQGTPIMSHLINDFPWSPRWMPAQMAERIFEHIINETVSFKSYCESAYLR